MSVKNRSRAALELVVFLVVIFSLWTVRATYGYAYDASIASDTFRALYGNLVKFILWVVPAFGFARWIRKSKPTSYLGISTIPTARPWMESAILIASYLAAVIGFETLRGSKTPGLAGISFSISTVGVLFYLVSPILEEILFRGLILKECVNLVPRGMANVLTSLLFVGIHLPYWLSHGGLTQQLIGNAIGIFIFSLLAGWLYLRSGSIWPAAVAHIANNALASVLKAGT